MSKKFDKKLQAIEDQLDDFSDDLDEVGYSIMETYRQSMPETLANLNPDEAIDELLDEYFDDGCPLEDED